MTSDRPDFAGMDALRQREAGYSVAREALRLQADAEKRFPDLRSPRGVILDGSARSWFVGALGEIAVGRVLGALGPDWFVRHSVPIGTGTTDVDHLVIGPPGVFAINTKHHSGADIWVGDRVLMVNGEKTWYLRNSGSEARNVEGRLSRGAGFSVAVTPVLAFVEPAGLKDVRTGDERPVAVVSADQLVAWLTGLPRAMSDAAVQRITLEAEDVRTWHIDPRSADTLRVMPRFERLRTEVTNVPNSIPDLASRPIAAQRMRAGSGRQRQPRATSRGRTRAVPGAAATGRRVIALGIALVLAAVTTSILWAVMRMAAAATAGGGADHMLFQVASDQPLLLGLVLLGLASAAVGSSKPARRSRSRR